MLGDEYLGRKGEQNQGDTITWAVLIAVLKGRVARQASSCCDQKDDLGVSAPTAGVVNRRSATQPLRPPEPFTLCMSPSTALTSGLTSVEAETHDACKAL